MVSCCGELPYIGVCGNVRAWARATAQEFQGNVT